MPNVFIHGNHIGGADSTIGLDDEGKLVPLGTDETLFYTLTIFLTHF